MAMSDVADEFLDDEVEPRVVSTGTRMSQGDSGKDGGPKAQMEEEDQVKVLDDTQDP